MFRRKKKQDDQAAKPKRTFVQQVLEWVKAFAFAFAVMVPLRASLVDWFDVPSGSMEPTIIPGDRIYVNKLAYGLRVPLTKEPCRWITRWDTPARGEVVICYSPEAPEHIRLVKRVVAVGNDTIEFRAGRLFVNGQEAAYGSLSDEVQKQIGTGDYGVPKFSLETVDERSHPVMHTPHDRETKIMEMGGQLTKQWGQPTWTPSNFGPVTIPSGKVFVCGDSRDQSRDSRFFGFIDETQVVGRSPAVVFSFRVLPGPRLVIKWDRFFRGIP